MSSPSAPYLDRPAPGWPAWADWVPVALLWLAAGLALAFAGTMADANRDLYHALQIVKGEELALAGPAVAHSFHYGPIWFYILALPLAVTQSWLSVSLTVGLLAASVIPLSYLLGRRLGGRSLGLIAAAWMALPSWMAVYWLVYSHPALIPAGVAAGGLMMSHWQQGPSNTRALLLGVVLSLAVHAHIVTLGLLPLAGLLMVCCLWRQRGQLVSQLLLLCLGFALPFAPYLIEQALNGWQELKAGAQYAGETQLIDNLLALPAAWRGGLSGGPAFALSELTALPPMAVSLLLALYAAIAGAGLIGLTLRPRQRWIGWAIGSLVTLSFTGIVVRNFTPFYQVLGLLPPLALLISAGLVRLAPRLGPPVLLVLAIGTVALQLTHQRQVARQGVFSLDVGMIGDLRQWTSGPTLTRWVLPAHGRDDNADWLCTRGDAPLLALGPWAAMLEASQLLEVDIRCPDRRPPVFLLHPDREVETVAGLHRALAEALGIDGTAVANMLLVRPERVIGMDRQMPISDAADYPPPDPLIGPTSRRRIELTLAPDEVLVAVNVLNVINPGATLRLNSASRLLPPLYADGAAAAWRCEDCTRPLQLHIEAIRPEWIQVFTLRDVAMRQASPGGMESEK